jgi:hypothetical protein
MQSWSNSPDLHTWFPACADLRPHARFCVYPGQERFPLDDATDAIGLTALAALLGASQPASSSHR